jgi:catechol 2,3-dioxygenase-like lactoylglutathione lyase family enzyme
MLNEQYLGLEHIGLPVSDIEKTVAFYEGLGFKVAHRNASGSTPIVFMQIPGLEMEFYGSPETPKSAGAVDHFAITVKDVEIVHEALKAGGYEIIDGGIQDLAVWENGVRYVKIYGPDREIIEFLQKL